MEDDGDEKDDSKRKTRNLSEKKRRDQFNSLVHELGSMISTHNRKMDKSSILKTTIAFLKNHEETIAQARAHDVQEDWKPGFLSNEEFTYLVLEALEGFVIVFSAIGRIYYVSESVASILGHDPNDVVNKSIYDFVYEEDRSNLHGLLQNPDMSVHAPPGANTENEIRFHCHLRRGKLDFREEASYELIQFSGHFSTDMAQNEKCDIKFEDDHESRLVYFCIAKLCTPQLVRDVSLADANHKEFISRHSLEWKFLFLDHRAPTIIGYLPFEVLGTSGYDYYHFDDLEKVVTCHEALMEKGELTSCFYRFLTKGQQWIWLQSRFYITYHQWHSKPEFVVCTHRVVSYVDVDAPTKENEEQEIITPEPSKSGIKEQPPVSSVAVTPVYQSEPGEPFRKSQSPAQTQSLKSAATSVGTISATVATTGTPSITAKSWLHPAPALLYGADVKTASASSSQPRGSQKAPAPTQEPPIVPQQNIGAQYLEPVPYVGAVGTAAVVPLPIRTLPVIVAPGQAQMQVRLQRTHRELQQMIARQNEELRQVKEQLMLARLGIYNPGISVQDPHEDSEETLTVSHSPIQILFDGVQSSALGGFPPQQLHQPQPHQLIQPQPHLLQPHPAQQLPTQPHEHPMHQTPPNPSQPLPSQQVHIQQHASQQLACQQHTSQQHYTQQHNSQQHTSQQLPSQQHAHQQLLSHQLLSQQHHTQQRHFKQRPSPQHNSQQVSSQQVSSQQHHSQQLAPQQHHSQQLVSRQLAAHQHTSQKHISQQLPSQQLSSQQHTSQQLASRQHHSHQLAAHKYTSQQHISQPLSSAQHNSQQLPAHQHTSQQLPSQQHTSQQHTSQQLPSQQLPSQQHNTLQLPSQLLSSLQHFIKQHHIQQQHSQQLTSPQHPSQQLPTHQHTTHQHTSHQHTSQQHHSQQLLSQQFLSQQHTSTELLSQQFLCQHHSSQRFPSQEHLPQSQHSQQYTSQHHQSLSHTSQQHPPQLNLSQLHLSQQHPSHSHSSQMHTSQQHPSQSHSAQQQHSQQHPSQLHPSQLHPMQQHLSQQHPSQQHPSQMHTSQPRQQQRHHENQV